MNACLQNHRFKQSNLQSLRDRYPWPSEKPAVPPNMNGWFQTPNQKMLSQLCSDQPQVVVELGSWLGLSARFFLDIAPKAMERPRFGTFTLRFGQEGRHGNMAHLLPTLENMTQSYPWPLEKPNIQPDQKPHTEFNTEVQDLLEVSVSRESRFILVIGDPLGKIARRIIHLASQATIVTCNHWKNNGEFDGYDSLDRFYAENWSYQKQIFTIPRPIHESLFVVTESQEEPDRIFLDSDSLLSFDNWHETFRLLTDMFPQTAMLGNGWNRNEIRDHLISYSQGQPRALEFRDLTWRLGQPQNTPQQQQTFDLFS